MSFLRKTFLLTAAVLAAGTASFAASTAPARPEKPVITGTVDLQKLIAQFNSQRDAMLANREALLSQLKNATEEQKKALLEKLDAQQKDLLDQQRALGRQIRDEMRKLKQVTPATHR
jgi:hypothetical protein